MNKHFCFNCCNSVEDIENHICCPESARPEMDYVIIRTVSAGVFAGFLKQRTGDEVVLVNARRLWHWSGAASLSELAMRGVKYPHECHFPCTVPTITLLGVSEIIPMTPEAKKSIEEVPEWRA
jgi:hypothetical protein